MKAQFFLLFVFFNTFFCAYSFSQAHSKDTLYVESVDFNILTFSSISCAGFATNFKERIKFRVISDKDTLGRLSFFLTQVRYTRKIRDIDVRAKFICEKANNTKITICTNGYEVLIDGRLIRHNIKFVNFLRGLII